jgi:hypothetical protein
MKMVGAFFLGLFLFVVCTCYSVAHAAIEVTSGLWLIARGFVVLLGSPFMTASLSVDAARRYARGEPLERILDVTPKRPAAAGPRRMREKSRIGTDGADDRWRRLGRISGPLPGL